MKKRTTLDTALTPDGLPIALVEQDGEYSIRVAGVELMSTRRHNSEDRLADLACAHVARKPGARVLIGGLGFGFTLKAALAALRPDARVTVAEIMPSIVAWNRNPELPLAAAALTDPRVTVIEQDVYELIRNATTAFDSVILDVDNGPAALTAGSNQRLYEPAGLLNIRTALRPGGCAAFWSATPDPAFERSLARAGFTATSELCRAHKTSGGRHTLFLGRVK